MSKRPDIVNDLPDGSREELYFRKHPAARGELAMTRKIVDPDGQTREVWHEVYDRAGTVLHRHQIPIRRGGQS